MSYLWPPLGPACSPVQRALVYRLERQALLRLHRATGLEQGVDVTDLDAGPYWGNEGIDPQYTNLRFERDAYKIALESIRLILLDVAGGESAPVGLLAIGRVLRNIDNVVTLKSRSS